MKKKFLEALSYYLRNLEQSQRDDILAFYEERFALGISYEGKSESEIVNELESPQQIAKNVLKEFNQYDDQLFKKTPNQIETGPVIGVVLLDVFFISWFVPMMFTILASLIAGWGALTLSLFSSRFMESTTSVFGSYMFMIGVVILWLLMLAGLYEGIRQFVYWVVTVHTKAFGRGVPIQLESFFNKISVKRLINKSTQLRFYSRMLFVIGLAALIIGGFVTFAQTGMLGGFTESPEVVEVDYRVTPSSGDHLRINAELINAGIVVKTHDSSDILIVGEISENEPVEIIYDQGTLSLVQESQIRIVIFQFNFRSLSQKLTVYIPQDMIVTETEIQTTNASISVENINLAQLKASTTNGSITINNVLSNTLITLKTTNGRLNLNAVSAVNYDIITTNGKIVLRNLNDAGEPGSHLSAKSTNGNVELENVYVHQVTLKTTNGDIDYYNQDRNFFVSKIDANTTNGRTNIDVPRN